MAESDSSAEERLLSADDELPASNDSRPSSRAQHHFSSIRGVVRRLRSQEALSLRAVLVCLGALALLAALAGSWSILRKPSSAQTSPDVGRFEYRPTLDYNKRAILVEKRAHRNLVPLLHDFLLKVPPEWPFQVWCGSENEPILRASRLLAPHIASGKLNLTRLPDEDALYDGNTLSKFLTVPWFWEQLAPAEHIFFFQLDSVICSKSNKDLNDFLGLDVVPGGYAWLGAVWFQFGYPAVPFWGGNGGFSLRRRSAMLDITLHNTWDGTAEDMWFSRLVYESDGKWPISTQDEAMRFAHETIPQEASGEGFDWAFRPLGVHTGTYWSVCGQRRWEDIRKLVEWCPELKMIAPHHCLL